MTIANPVARGNEAHAASPSTDSTFVSSTFTPAVGAMLVGFGFPFIVADIDMSIADTFGDGGTWAEVSNTLFSATIEKGVFFFSKIVGASPGSGAITITRDGGSVAEDSQCVFYEITATGALSVVQTQSSAAQANNLTGTFSPAPAVGSLCLGGISDDASGGGGGAIVPPSGWTELHDAVGAFGAGREIAYKNGSSATAPNWTGLIATGTAARLIIVEVAEAAVALPFKQTMVRQAVQRAAVR